MNLGDAFKKDLKEYLYIVYKMFPFTNNFKLAKKDYTRSIYHTKNTKINECIDENLIKSFIKSVKGIEFSNKHPQKNFLLMN